MARFNFRQGIVRHQTDNVGNPTHMVVNGQFVDLVISPDPVLFVMAHLTEDYLVTESNSVSEAWGPFSGPGTDYLYWDIDLLDGELTRGSTTIEPIVSSSPPPSPTTDQMWFDTGNKVSKLWTGSRWVNKVRVMAGTLSNSAVLTTEPLGTQAGLSTPTTAGTILFDDEGKPVQKWTRLRDGLFLTSETPLVSQFHRLANFRVEAAILQAKAFENIPINRAIAYAGPNEIRLASNTAPDTPAIGISSEDMSTGEVRAFVTKGYVQNYNDWNWTEPAGTSIFVGLNGDLTTSPPQFWSIQRIAIVVDPVTIFVNPQDIVIYL